MEEGVSVVEGSAVSCSLEGVCESRSSAQADARVASWGPIEHSADAANPSGLEAASSGS